jgi:23S rRNA (adenine2030-N6)-methyltransferase
MNYRHVFHAGNFADVFKHAIVARILVYLMRKDAALRYLDTHAGIGKYDLGSEQAEKTGEWRDGVARVAKAKIPADIDALLKPWLTALGPLDEAGRPAIYPGSPMLAQRLLRPQDRMTLCDLHDQDVRVLGRNMGKDLRIKVIRIDGYMALKAYVPPIERRGLVLIDPPFESTDEFTRMRDSVIAAWRKWPTGTYALWYPVKDSAAVDGLHDGLAAAGIGRILRAEIDVGLAEATGKLSGCGLAIINPPHPLFDEIKTLAPWLAKTMAQGATPRWTCAWTAGET